MICRKNTVCSFQDALKNSNFRSSSRIRKIKKRIISVICEHFSFSCDAGIGQKGNFARYPEHSAGDGSLRPSPAHVPALPNNTAMKQPPEIQVQLVHIDGPMKGEIQEFSGPVVTLGRHPDCDVVFPAEMTVISRHHAEIRREGNRFKLVDHSTNGTYVNGKQAKELFLKDGDVLIIGTDGPKISFLTAMRAPATGGPEKEQAMEQAIPAAETAAESSPAGPAPAPVPPPVDPRPRQQPAAAEKRGNRPVSPPAQKPATVARPLVIQYGATLKTFNLLPVTIGRGADCDFSLDHPAILARHARISFDQGSYRISDLTGRHLVTVNLQPAGSETELAPDARIALAPDGPRFQFLGDGRLAELPDTEVKPDTAPARPAPGSASPAAAAGGRNRLLAGIILAAVCLAALLVLLFFFGRNDSPAPANPLLQRLHQAGRYLHNMFSG